jgi:hypothetical protein
MNDELSIQRGGRVSLRYWCGSNQQYDEHHRDDPDQMASDVGILQFLTYPRGLRSIVVRGGDAGVCLEGPPASFDDEAGLSATERRRTEHAFDQGVPARNGVEHWGVSTYGRTISPERSCVLTRAVTCLRRSSYAAGGARVVRPRSCGRRQLVARTLPVC